MLVTVLCKTVNGYLEQILKKNSSQLIEIPGGHYSQVCDVANYLALVPVPVVVTAPVSEKFLLTLVKALFLRKLHIQDFVPGFNLSFLFFKNRVIVPFEFNMKNFISLNYFVYNLLSD